MMGTYGKPCRWCGARLDPGEKCDCAKADQEGMSKTAENKTHVSVITIRIPGNEPKPIRFQLPDGCSYRIDRVGNPTQAPTLKAAGQGLRYEVRVMDKTTYLYLDNGIWFIEEKVRAA